MKASTWQDRKDYWTPAPEDWTLTQIKSDEFWILLESSFEHAELIFDILDGEHQQHQSKSFYTGDKA